MKAPQIGDVVTSAEGTGVLLGVTAWGRFGEILVLDPSARKEISLWSVADYRVEPDITTCVGTVQMLLLAPFAKDVAPSLQDFAISVLETLALQRLGPLFYSIW